MLRRPWCPSHRKCVCLPKEIKWIYILHQRQPLHQKTSSGFPQPATPSLPSCPSLGRLPLVALAVCVRLVASSNDGGFSYGGGATTNVGAGAARGVMVNSSSILVPPRLASLLWLTILAYNTEARKSRRMVPMLTPTMSPVLDRYLSRIGGWCC